MPNTDDKPVDMTAAAGSGAQQVAREDCAVGDWIEVSLVPEWKGRSSPRTFLRRSVSISPEDGNLGGIVPLAEPQPWMFVATQRAGKAVWIRER